MEESEEERPLSEQESEKQLDDVLSKFNFGFFHLKVLLLTCGAYFSACSEMMLIVFLSKPVKQQWNLDDMMFPILPFCCGIIGFISSFAFGSLSDRFGRQKPLLIALAIVSIFGIVSAFAPSFWTFVVLRALVACGTSGIETVNFVLLLECLPQKKRGCIMVVITLCGALGAVLTASLAWAILPRLNWRWFVGACAAPACCVTIYGLIFRPESPRFLYVSGRREEGLAVLKKIAEQSKNDMPTENIVCPPTKDRGRIQDLFSRDLRGRTLVASGVWFLQSMGYWSVTMYLPEYMGSIGIDPYLNTFSVFIGEIPGLLLAMVLIEPTKLGRIKCLRFFSFFSAVCLVLFAFINVKIVRAVCVVLVFFFMVPIYSILNTFTPEVYPTESRGVAMAWMYMMIAFPGLITAFIGASVLSTNITWLYPTVAAIFFSLQLLLTLGLKQEPAGRGLSDSKAPQRACSNDVNHHDVEEDLTSLTDDRKTLHVCNGLNVPNGTETA
ncbi:SVOP-like protein [Mya arenaria]|uniref:SVOP-like protein n=1 Tax=Mya arenaria TaxID=6604 RepID=A0ABY7DVE9_MYAAR|nr:synaptic vesicle 2-related protein-like [Mya arenaria]WAR01685.1 SVOP-like protein [Mya arenaria]